MLGYTPGRYTPWAGTPTPWRIHPQVHPQQVHPLAGTPPWQVHPLAGTPPGRYTSLAGTPPGQVHHPGRYTPWAGTHCPGQVHPHVQCMLGYGQQAGGTHPTGMQSCDNNRACYKYQRKNLKFCSGKRKF